MRHALLGSLSLAVGLAASPAFAQDYRTAQSRGVRLGPATAVATDNTGVTPAGLLAAPDGSAFPAVPVVPSPMPLPQPGMPGLGAVPAPPPLPPPGGTPLGGMPLGGTPLAGAIPAPGGLPLAGTAPAPGAMLLPAPTPLPGMNADSPLPLQNPQPGAGPSVTETRTPGGAPAPEFPGYPAITGAPYAAPPDVGYPPPVNFSAPGVGDCPPDCAPNSAIGRLCGCSHWYASAEALMWWTRSMQTPPLLTTSSPAASGIPGVGNTRTIYGGDIGDTFHGGARFDVGNWFGENCLWGVEGRVFFLGYDPSTFTANSSQYPVLARPFYNTNFPTGPFSELVAYPGLATGSASVTSQTFLWGGEANVRRVLMGNNNGSGFELDAILGYRYLDLDEKLGIQENFFRVPGSNMSVGTPAVAGSVFDSFHTTDVFNGGQIGLHAGYQSGPWSVDARTTVAFGDLEQSAYINGGQTLYFANGSVTHTAGGLLALPGANLGTHHHSEFAVLPEVDLNLGYQITSHLRVYVGYDFLFLGNALRPGGAIDYAVDAARIPNFPLPGVTAPLGGAPHPGPYFVSSNFWAQGISFGLQYTW